MGWERQDLNFLSISISKTHKTDVQHPLSYLFNDKHLLHTNTHHFKSPDWWLKKRLRAPMKHVSLSSSSSLCRFGWGWVKVSFAEELLLSGRFVILWPFLFLTWMLDLQSSKPDLSISWPVGHIWPFGRPFLAPVKLNVNQLSCFYYEKCTIFRWRITM